MALADAEHHTVLIERKHIGGTCVNEGCTPAKKLIASGRIAHLMSRAASYGIPCTRLPVDWSRIRQRMTEVVDFFREGSTRNRKEYPNRHVSHTSRGSGAGD